MQNKKILPILVILIGVFLVAGVLYSRLSAQVQPQAGLVTVPTETTAATTEAVAQTQATEAAEPQDYAAPDFTVQDWDGNPVKLSDYFGKPIVLNFWANWCGPCQTEMPEFNAVYEELGGEVTFLMVHVGADEDLGKELVTENGYTFPVVFDTASEAAANYGITAFPTSFFIDAAGNLQAYYVGAMDQELLQLGLDRIYAAEGEIS